MALHEFFLMFAIVLLAARLMGEFGERLGVPVVIAELLAGVLVGPSVLGWVTPNPTLTILAEIGVVMLLFEVGMDTDIYRMAKAGSKPIVVALVGFIAPLLLGFACAYWVFDLPLMVSIFIGGTITATSIGITVRVLTDLGRKSSDEAQIVVGAAVLDDIFGVITLAFLYQVGTTGDVTAFSLARVALFILLFMVLAPIVAKMLGWLIGRYDAHRDSPGLMLTLVISLILVFSYLAHEVGAPVIMGGFAAGMALGHSFRVKLPYFPRLNRMLARDPDIAHRLEPQMRPIIHLFSPVFFVMVGISLDFQKVDWGSPWMWSFAFVLFAIAMLTKIAAGFCIREPRVVQTVIGLSMVPRGEVGLIFAQLGASHGVLSEDVYAVLLLVIALTTFLPPFLLKWYYSRHSEKFKTA